MMLRREAAVEAQAVLKNSLNTGKTAVLNAWEQSLEQRLGSPSTVVC